jgi:hypothetical protein
MPIDRRKLIQRLRKFGLTGPFSGGRHQFMIKGQFFARKIYPNKSNKLNKPNKLNKQLPIDLPFESGNAAFHKFYSFSKVLCVIVF